MQGIQSCVEHIFIPLHYKITFVFDKIIIKTHPVTFSHVRPYKTTYAIYFTAVFFNYFFLGKPHVKSKSQFNCCLMTSNYISAVHSKVTRMKQNKQDRLLLPVTCLHFHGIYTVKTDTDTSLQTIHRDTTYKDKIVRTICKRCIL